MNQSSKRILEALNEQPMLLSELVSTLDISMGIARVEIGELIKLGYIQRGALKLNPATNRKQVTYEVTGATEVAKHVDFVQQTWCSPLEWRA